MALSKSEGMGRIRHLLAIIEVSPQWCWQVQVNERLIVGDRLTPRSDRNGREADLNLSQ